MTTKLRSDRLLFNDGTAQTTKALSLGLWNSRSGNLWGSSRFENTTYTNSTGRPVWLHITGNNQPGNGNCPFYLDGVGVGGGHGYGTEWTLTLVVPPNSSYYIFNNNATVTNWYEY